MKRLPTVAVPAIALVAGLPTLFAPASRVAGAAYTLAFVFFVALAWLGVRRQTGRGRAAYALIAAALTTWLAGDLLYGLLSRFSGEVGDVTAADVFWIAGYPLLTAGLIQLVRLRAPGRLREAMLDGLAMTVVVSALFWQFLIQPAVAENSFDLTEVVGILYPFGDMQFFVAGTLLVLAPGGRGGPARYLLAAMAITFAGDVAISLTPYWFPDFDNSRLDAVLLLANALLAAALHDPAASHLAEPAGRGADERLHPGRVVFLGVALLSLPALADLRISDIRFGRTTLMTAMVLLTAVVLTRFTLVVRAQERGREALAHRATHDQLTGLLNRQELHHRLSVAMQQGAGGGPVVHFLDLNGFKPINDRYGHAAGDRVLVEVARRLRATVRATDTVARLGGDEFVVVSPTVADAAGLTARLRAAVTAPIDLSPATCGQPAEIVVPAGYLPAHPVNGVGVAAGAAADELILGTSVSVQVSIGVSVAGALAHPTADALLAAADAAMYVEKDLTSTYRSA